MPNRACILLALVLLLAAACTPILEPPVPAGSAQPATFTPPPTFTPGPTQTPTPEPVALQPSLAAALRQTVGLPPGPVMIAEPVLWQNAGSGPAPVSAADAAFRFDSLFTPSADPLILDKVTAPALIAALDPALTLDGGQNVVWMVSGLPAAQPAQALLVLRAGSVPPVLEQIILPPVDQPFLGAEVPETLVTAGATLSGVNLRAGPSTLFAVRERVSPGVQFTADARTPGSEWLRVRLASGAQGWMTADSTVVELQRSKEALPVILPEDALLAYGSTLAPEGSPIGEVIVAVHQGTSRTDAVSGADGRFYAFLPASSAGSWTVEVVGLPCLPGTETSGCLPAAEFDLAPLSITLPAAEIVFTALPR